MKKILVILLVFFYLGTASGFAMHSHYCMGEMIHLGLTNSDSKTCDNCGMEKSHSIKNGCCKDELKKIQTDDSSRILVDGFLFNSLSPAIINIPTFFKVNSNRFIAQVEEIPVGNDPPIGRLVPVYLRNCNFQI